MDLAIMAIICLCMTERQFQRIERLIIFTGISIEAEQHKTYIVQLKVTVSEIKVGENGVCRRNRMFQ